MLRKRSIRIAGHATSISLEDPFWQALLRIAQREGRTVNDLVARIDDGRTAGLSGSIRLFVLADLERRAGDRKSDTLGVS